MKTKKLKKSLTGLNLKHASEKLGAGIEKPYEKVKYEHDTKAMNAVKPKCKRK